MLDVGRPPPVAAGGLLVGNNGFGGRMDTNHRNGDGVMAFWLAELIALITITTTTA